jgi:hypothetical protein
MSLLADALRGVQSPQIVHRPPGVVSLDAATEAIELADAYGICDGHPLDDSQRFTLTVALGERADGSWAASTVADFEPRQNGKNDTCNARELAGLILFGEKLIIHTAHEFPTANESFLRLVAVFENWDDLRRKVARIRYANGEQGIELLSGQRLKYRARTGGSGRGFAKADLTVYDEAQHLQAEHIAASGPAKLANPNSQSWYMGSGGLSTSVNAWRLRARAVKGDAGRLAYVEHSAESLTVAADGQLVSVRPPDLLDREAWALANSAYGWRITDEKLLDLYDELGPEMFARECLCVWDPLPGVAGEPVISLGAWAKLRDDGPPTWHEPIVLGVDASPDRQWSSIAFAAHRSDGLGYVELLKHERGVAWLAESIIRNREEWGDPLVAVDTSSPAASVLAELEAAGVRVAKFGPAKLAQACGAFIDAVTDRSLRHHDDLPFGPALLAARQRSVGDGWAWSRRDSTSDITAIVAATLAFGALPAAGTNEHTFSPVVDLGDY